MDRSCKSVQPPKDAEDLSDFDELFDFGSSFVPFTCQRTLRNLNILF